MLDPKKLTYDESTTSLAYSSGIRGATTLGKDVAQALGTVARAGEHEGRAVTHVYVDFVDDEAANHNAQLADFYKISARANGQVVKSGASFVPRKDFGIDA
jgi:hypothetical protein